MWRSGALNGPSVRQKLWLEELFCRLFLARREVVVVYFEVFTPVLGFLRDGSGKMQLFMELDGGKLSSALKKQRFCHFNSVLL